MSSHQLRRFGLLGSFLACAILASVPALAQSSVLANAKVVQTCGASSYPVGQSRILEMTTAGVLCSSTSAGGGGGAATIADGANVTQGAKADAKSTATDTTPITQMQVLKQVSASVQRFAAGSGVSASATFTPAAAAYGAADVMDVAKQFSFTYSDGTVVPPGTQIRILSAVVKIDITAIPSGQTSYTLPLYSVTPPSAQADNAAWTLASADLPAFRGQIALGTPADLGSALYVRTQYVDDDIALASGQTSLFGELVTDGAHTSAAVARTVILYGIIP